MWICGAWTFVCRKKNKILKEWKICLFCFQRGLSTGPKLFLNSKTFTRGWLDSVLFFSFFFFLNFLRERRVAEIERGGSVHNRSRRILFASIVYGEFSGVSVPRCVTSARRRRVLFSNHRHKRPENCCLEVAAIGCEISPAYLFFVIVFLLFFISYSLNFPCPYCGRD